jgi:hypothetical protein
MQDTQIIGYSDVPRTFTTKLELVEVVQVEMEL